MMSVITADLDDELSPQNSIEDRVEVVSIKKVPSADSPRINPDDVKTEEHAIIFFESELVRRYRFFRYDNMIDNLTTDELEDALYDALEIINQTPPIWSGGLLDYVKLGRRYRRLLLHGAAYYALMTLWSEWSANGMNISIEDLAVDNKTGDIQTLMDAQWNVFQELLKEMKEYDRMALKVSTFSTGLYSRNVGQSVYNTRISSIIRTGGRL